MHQTVVEAVDVRWAIRRDLPAVLAIEKASFAFAWEEQDFCSVLRNPKCFGMVAEVGEEIVGYILCQVDADGVEVIHLAVDPARRRQGIATQLLEHLRKTKSVQKHPRLEAVVRESNLDSCRFFNRSGFRAVEVFRGFYEDSGEDGYRFVVMQ